MTWKKIAIYSSEIQRMCDKGNHSRCTAEYCYEVEAAQQAHARKTHDYSSCMPSTCKAVAQSHKTDHKLCNDTNCKVVRGLHKKENHSLCSSYGCFNKEMIDIAHNLKLHCLDCSPYVCKDVAESHATDHAMCNSRWCELIAAKHNNDDHSICHASWCLAKQTQLHDADDHKFCRLFDCGKASNIYGYLSLAEQAKEE